MKPAIAVAILACLVAIPSAGVAAAAAAPMIHAHRGGSVLDGVPSFPENTMPAFRHATREGYVLEMDVKLTADRVPVVFHDPELDRVTACTGVLADRTLAQLRACPVDVLGSPGGGLATAPAARPEPIPTLAEVLVSAGAEGAVVNLEIKNQPGDEDFDQSDRFAREVMDAVLASGFPKERLIVQSFYPPNLDVAKRRLPGVETSLLTLSALNPGAPAFAQANGYDWVSPQWPVARDFVEEAQGRGLTVVPFTLNAAEEIQDAAGVGVDALITDDPALGQRTLGLSRAQLVADRLRPQARIRAPRFASDSARGPRFRLRLSGEDRGSGLAGLTLETRRNALANTRWRRVGREGPPRSVLFRGLPGQTHRFRVRARDRFGNFSRYAYGVTTVPLDDRSRRLRYSGGWRRLRSQGAYARTLRRAVRPGASVTLRFRGDRVALVARRSRRGGRVLVRVAGRQRTVSLRGPRAARRVVFRSRRLPPGVHRMRATLIGPGVADLDAVAAERGPSPP